ncbi:MAG: EAL domain-containing protein, partial [Acidimicrobiales bacterium]|nr:EAL domain-containing protein [Acidimicrobiales bacterium]
LTGTVISARRDALAASRRVSAIVEATPDLVASAWRDGSIAYLNPVGRELLGFQPERDPGGRAFDFLPDQLAEDLMRQGMRIAEQQGTWTGENRLIRPDGHVIPISQVLLVHSPDPNAEQMLYSTICRDISDQRALEDQLRQAALFDRATGLANRALLEEQLSRALAAGGRPRRVAVLFADVDRLQHVNETFGFQVGDHVVSTIAGRLRGLVRGQDLVARHGGSQFVVVLTEVPDEFEAIALANRLLGSFAEPVEHDTGTLQVTGSVGITVADLGDDHLHVLRSAEIALHRAKEAGGGRFALFDDAMHARSQRRLETEADLREVLATGAWTLAYQPIFDSVDRRVVSVEALLRWSHPTRGAVSPGELIALAESSGAIVHLGREIFRRACSEACGWHAMGYPLPVHINVSARQLREPTFVDDVHAVIDETGIDPRAVIVELTETTVATREHGEIDTLHALRELGCRVALDDFGTGYSSLAELRDLPIDQVKLDQSFTTELTTSPRAAAMVEAIVSLATALDLEVVAEGVERDGQIDALAELGCRRIQGFALSRAVAPEVIVGMLRDARPVADGDAGGQALTP